MGLAYKRATEDLPCRQNKCDSSPFVHQSIKDHLEIVRNTGFFKFLNFSKVLTASLFWLDLEAKGSSLSSDLFI